MPLAGEIIRASDVIPDGWTSYTPVWSSSGTQAVLNNGTLTGEFMQVGDLVLVRIVLTMGSTTTFGTSTYRLSLPVAPEVDQVIPGILNDSSAIDRYSANAWIIAATTGGDNMRISAGNGA